MEIYEPAEDSLLLKESLIKFLKTQNKKIKILDMGTGSGILGETCINEGFKDVLFVDKNIFAVKQLKDKNLNVIKSDLFSKISEDKFDLIIFNPPYLPLDKNEPKSSRLATTGGKNGYEIILRFLIDAKKFLYNKGKILLLISTLSKPEIILDRAKELGYKFKLINNKKIFFEELFVYEFSIE